VQQAHQAGAECDAGLGGRGHQSEHGAEGALAELFAGQERRQGDQVADAQAEDETAGHEDGGRGPRRHHGEGHALGADVEGGYVAEVHAIGQHAKHDAAEQGGHGSSAHREGRVALAEIRLQQADLVDDEAHLGGQREGERHHQRPQEWHAQHLTSRPETGLPDPLVGGARRAVALQLDGDLVSGRTAADDEEDERQADHEGGRAGRRRGELEASMLDQGNQDRHEHHAAHAGPGEREGHGEALAAAEPGQDRATDAGQAEAGPGRRQHQVDGEELPGGGDQAERGHRGGHGDDAVGEHAAGTVVVDDAADQHDAAGADRVVDRHRDRDEAGGPAVQAAQRVEIDAEPVEAEAPGEARDDAAGDDDGPAAVDGHGIVIRDAREKRVEPAPHPALSPGGRG
jgi:hypothetical protein